jgi:hypothetical protein
MAEFTTLLGTVATLAMLVGTLVKLGALTGEWRMKFETITNSLGTILSKQNEHDVRLRWLEVNIAKIEAKFGVEAAGQH